jgi:hypothetical protein
MDLKPNLKLASGHGVDAKVDPGLELISNLEV